MIFRSISTKSKTRQRYLFPCLSFNIVAKVLVKSVNEWWGGVVGRERERGSEGVRLFDSCGHDNVLIENPKESTHTVQIR